MRDTVNDFLLAAMPTIPYNPIVRDHSNGCPVGNCIFLRIDVHKHSNYKQSCRSMYMYSLGTLACYLKAILKILDVLNVRRLCLKH